MPNKKLMSYGVLLFALIFCYCNNSIVSTDIQKEDLIGVWSKIFTKVRMCEAADLSGQIVDTTLYKTSYNFKEDILVINRNWVIESNCINIVVLSPKRKWFVQNDTLYAFNPFINIVDTSGIADTVYSTYSLKWFGDNGLIISDTSITDTCFRENM